MKISVKNIVMKIRRSGRQRIAISNQVLRTEDDAELRDTAKFVEEFSSLGAIRSRMEINVHGELQRTSEDDPLTNREKESLLIQKYCY